MTAANTTNISKLARAFLALLLLVAVHRLYAVWSIRKAGGNDILTGRIAPELKLRLKQTPALRCSNSGVCVGQVINKGGNQLLCLQGVTAPWYYRNISSASSLQLPALAKLFGTYQHYDKNDQMCMKWPNSMMSLLSTNPMGYPYMTAQLQVGLYARHILQGRQPIDQAQTWMTHASQLGVMFDNFQDLLRDGNLALLQLARLAAAESLCSGASHSPVCKLCSELHGRTTDAFNTFGEIPFGLLRLREVLQHRSWSGASSTEPGHQQACSTQAAAGPVNIIWGPTVRHSTSLDLLDRSSWPVLAADGMEGAYKYPGFKRKVRAMGRRCDWRFGFVVFLPTHINRLTHIDCGELALLAALLSTAEPVILIGRTRWDTARVVEQASLHFNVQATNVHFDTEHTDAIFTDLKAKLQQQSDIRYMIEVDMRQGWISSIGDTQDSAKQQPLECLGSLKDSLQGLAQLRLQLCKWHPALAVVGDRAMAERARFDAYDLGVPLMRSLITATEINVAHTMSRNRLIALLGGGSQARNNPQALRAAMVSMAALLYSQFTMVVPLVFTEIQPLRDVFQVRTWVRMAAGNLHQLVGDNARCPLRKSLVQLAVEDVLCVFEHEAPCIWPACHRIGGSFVFDAGTARSCKARGAASGEQLLQPAATMMQGASYRPSTVGEETCKRTALGVFGLFGAWADVGPLLTHNVLLPTRAHTVLGLPSGTDTGGFVTFIPGAVAFDLSSELSLLCWTSMVGISLPKLLAADDSTNNMFTGLGKRKHHVMEQHRDHAAILAMLMLLEAAYNVQHDQVISQRGDVIWLRKILPSVGISSQFVKHLPVRACLIGDRGMDSLGYCDHAAVCSRAGYAAYASALQHMLSIDLHTIASSVKWHTGTTNAESFLKWRLDQARVIVHRDEDAFTRTCALPHPQNTSEPVESRERGHNCMWLPALQVWDVPAQTKFVPGKYIEATSRLLQSSAAAVSRSNGEA